MELSTRLCQVGPYGHPGATSGPKPQLHPLRVEPTRQFPPSRCRRRRRPCGGPRTGDTCRLFGHATTPPRMYKGPVRRSGGIATPSALSCLTLERLTTRSCPLTFHGQALNSGPLHPVMLGQLRGTPGSNIRVKPTATSPPCRPDASVSPLQVPAAAPSVREATHRRRVPPLRTCHNTTPHV